MEAICKVYTSYDLIFKPLHYKSYVDTVFGSKEILRMYEQRKKVRSNPFTQLMSSLNLMPAQASLLWKGLSKRRKSKIKDLADSRKADYDSVITDLDSKVADYDFRGPLGSRAKKLPVHIAGLHKELNESNSSVLQSWKRANLRQWYESMGTKKKPFRMSARCAALHRYMIIVNSCCSQRLILT